MSELIVACVPGIVDDQGWRWISGIRDRPGFRAFIGKSEWWIQVDTELVKDAVQILSLLPNTQLYRVDNSHRLIPWGKSVPTGTLPKNIVWEPLEEWTRLNLPIHQILGGDSHDRMPLRLERHDCEFVPGAMLCTFRDWSSYVLNNFQQRWSSLRFACYFSSTDMFASLKIDTLVVGTPLPSIPGLRLSCRDHILVPIPFSWYPNVPTGAIRRSLAARETDWLLWTSNSEIELITDDALIATSRASIRATNLSSGGIS